MNMNAIVAADKNWAIGYKNKLLVSIPADMKFFRQMTGGKVVVMGRKTLESFPNGLPLKNRTNIVLTGNPNYHVKDAVIVHTTEELLDFIEDILRHNPDSVVIVDEAYIDFAGKSALELIDRYENLLVVQTFSKSRSMAGMRIGFAIGNPELIGYLNDAKYSFNSYTMNQAALLCGAQNEKERKRIFTNV